jgi:predicted unusual protein kinase regulating ubiquinone biosynthesis (AarF/ABC1/UbiB family)
MQGVYVPGMHTSLCTRKVLVMEWVDGERLRTAYSAARESGGTQPAAGVSEKLWRSMYKLLLGCCCGK